MSRPPARSYEFGPFRLEADERRLLRDGDELPLTPKVFELLLALVENNRHTLPKNELLDRVWAGSFVEENSLSRNVSILRKTLAVEGSDPYIKTVPKLGYRFEADVRTIVEDEEDVIIERRTRYSVQLGQEGVRESKVMRRVVAIASVMIAVGLLGFAVLVSRPDGIRPTAWASSETKPGVDPGAYDLYRRGRELWQSRSAAGLHQAILLLEQAVARDPGFALAHASLADAYAFDSRHWPKAESEARRAIELDPTLGNPYASIGFVKLFWEWKTREAETQFRDAIARSPDYATARQWYAINLAVIGHFNEARDEMERAIDLEPNSPAINADMCEMLYILQRYDEAEAQCKRTLRLDPMSFNAYSALYLIYTAQARYDDAVRTFLARERIATNSSTVSENTKSLAAAFESGGIGDYWRKRIEFLRAPGGSAYELARYHALLGEDEAAMLELERSCRSREFGYIFFFADPTFRRFVDHPRFEDLAAALVADRLPSVCGTIDQ
jgi:DNA-binding winged helix-turn-helix (wHTH) protein/tetratricopeptide (TPR) repeat protein